MPDSSEIISSKISLVTAMFCLITLTTFRTIFWIDRITYVPLSNPSNYLLPVQTRLILCRKMLYWQCFCYSVKATSCTTFHLLLI